MEYKFLGIELTPTVFQELLIKLFDGKQFSRKEAINTITKYHADNGGILNKSSYISVFKKASQKLKNSGISNIGYGVWKLTYTIKETKIYKPQNNQKQLLISSDKNIGTGKNAIYVDVSLIGPAAGEQVNEMPTTPYIVIKIEKREEPVIFKIW